MSNSLRVFIVVLAVVFIGVLSTVLLVGNRNQPNDAVLPEVETVTTADYVNNSQSRVVWMLEGKLVGEDERRALRITISPTERKAEILAGYKEKVIKTVKQQNTKEAYAEFLLALERFGYGNERETNEVDERGVCPFGRRYIYELFDGADQKLRLWSDSCSSEHGTFGGNARGVRNLFKQQITEFSDLIKGVRL